MDEFEASVLSKIESLAKEVEKLKQWERPKQSETDTSALVGRLSELERRMNALSALEGKLGSWNTGNPMIDQLLRVEQTVERMKVQQGFSKTLADTYYLGKTAKAADSDKLDGVDSTGFVNTTEAQSIAGIKTFSSIPVLPASNPTTDNQAVRKAYTDTTFLAVTAKAAGSDVTTGTDDTKYVTSKAIQDSFGFTAVGRAILDDATLSDQRNTLNLKLAPLATLSDDQATNITPTNPSGFLLFRLLGSTNYGLVSYDAVSGTAYISLMIGGANVAVRTGILSGTTGTDGKFTVSAHTDGKIYFENRLGSNVYIGYVAI